MNVLNFFGEDSTPNHPLKILKKVLLVIACNFQKQSYCKLSRQFSPSVVFVHILRQKNSQVNQLKTKVILKKVIFILAKVLGKPLFCNFNKLNQVPILDVTWVPLWNKFRFTIQPTQTFTFSQSTLERSEQCIKDIEHVSQLALVFLYLHLIKQIPAGY